MHQKPRNVEKVVLAACTMHNILRSRYPHYTNYLLDREDVDTCELIPGAWRDEDTLGALDAIKGKNVTRAIKGQREYLRGYYNSPVGRVPWQDRMMYVYRK